MLLNNPTIIHLILHLPISLLPLPVEQKFEPDKHEMMILKIFQQGNSPNSFIELNFGLRLKQIFLQ
jgi:hypothetical protein